MYCKKCGTELETNAKFCPNFGASTNANPEVQAEVVGTSEPKSLIAAALLAFFLGIFGAHNFYLGYKSKAMTQLLLTICSLFILSFVTAIWSFIEFIMILTGSITDSDGNKLKN